MAFDYTTSAETALRLIQLFGQKIEMTRLVRGDYDPIEGEFESSSENSGEFDGVLLPASKGTLEAFDVRLTESLTIDQVRFAILAAAGAPFQPRGTDVVSFEGKPWLVMGCTPLNPAGVPLVYKIGFRLA